MKQTIIEFGGLYYRPKGNKKIEELIGTLLDLQVLDWSYELGNETFFPVDKESRKESIVIRPANVKDERPEEMKEKEEVPF